METDFISMEITCTMNKYNISISPLDLSSLEPIQIKTLGFYLLDEVTKYISYFYLENNAEKIRTFEFSRDWLKWYLESTLHFVDPNYYTHESSADIFSMEIMTLVRGIDKAVITRVTPDVDWMCRLPIHLSIDFLIQSVQGMINELVNRAEYKPTLHHNSEIREKWENHCGTYLELACANSNPIDREVTNLIKCTITLEDPKKKYLLTRYLSTPDIYYHVKDKLEKANIIYTTDLYLPKN